MSTIDSGINSLTAVVVCDWLAGRDTSVRWSRVLCALFGLCVVGSALIVPLLANNVIGMIMTVAGTFLGLLLGLFLLGMFSARANTGGAMLGLLSGVVGCGAAILVTEIPHWWYGALTIFPTLAVGWAASRLFAPPSAEQQKGLWRPPS
jgi:Na+/proline symporter